MVLFLSSKFELDHFNLQVNTHTHTQKKQINKPFESKMNKANFFNNTNLYNLYN